MRTRIFVASFLVVFAAAIAIPTLAPYAVPLVVQGPRPQIAVGDTHGEAYTWTKAWVVRLDEGKTLKVSGDAITVAGMGWALRHNYISMYGGIPGTTGTTWETTPGYYYVVINFGEWDIMDCAQAQNPDCPPII